MSLLKPNGECCLRSDEQTHFDPELLAPVERLVPNRVAMDVVGRSLTTFAIGGSCRAVVTVETKQELQDVLRLLHLEQQSVVTLGFGSNVLIPDSGVNGWIVRLGGEFRISRRSLSGRFSCGAGASLMREARRASNDGLSGLEFAAGIPGSFGGAICMNAGAHGSELGELVAQVRGICLEGKTFELRGSELAWRYRSSGLPANFIVTEVDLNLVPGDRDAIHARCLSNLAHRKATQPLSMPSAGSVFKNPSPTLSAGKVIEEAGLKGYSIGQVSISDLHANWIVNPSKKGRAADVQELIEHCKKKVSEVSGIELEPEIRLWNSVG